MRAEIEQYLPAATQTSPVTTRQRVHAIDLLRGLMVALMVLDHVREYFSSAALQFEPTDMLRTDPALFATRWVTHLCAPTFVFLSGLSVQLQRGNGLRGLALRKRLWARGTWLIFLEVTVIGFAFNFAEPFFFLQVIWAIGFGMILLAFLVDLPPAVVAVIGVALVIFNPALSVATSPYLTPPLWHALFSPGPITPLPGVAAYPALPWAGILLLGYGTAPLIVGQDGTKRPPLLVGGAAMLLCFAALRMAGIGDPRGYGVGSTTILRTLSFLNVSKYPPSPQYVLITLGISAFLLTALEAVKSRLFVMLSAFGRAPFFTYILHIYLIHTIAMLVGLTLGLPIASFAGFIESSALLKDAHWGFGLGWVFAIWITTLWALKPFSVRFAELKSTRSHWWLSYF